MQKKCGGKRGSEGRRGGEAGVGAQKKGDNLTAGTREGPDSGNVCREEAHGESSRAFHPAEGGESPEGVKRKSTPWIREREEGATAPNEQQASEVGNQQNERDEAGCSKRGAMQ